MTSREWRVPVGSETTSAVYDPAPGEHSVFVCAHGAGGNLSDRAVVATARAMREHGFGTVRFNFLYRERKAGRPDQMPRLMETVEAVVQHVRNQLAPPRLIIGGRSMGGRAASMLAADGFPADGLLLLAYPLHPPGKPSQMRDAHLSRIEMPVLCFNGTRDPFCTPELMNRVVGGLGSSFEMHWIEGADHSFHVLKSSGRTDADVLDEIARVSSEWAERMRG